MNAKNSCPDICKYLSTDIHAPGDSSIK